MQHFLFTQKSVIYSDVFNDLFDKNIYFRRYFKPKGTLFYLIFNAEVYFDEMHFATFCLLYSSTNFKFYYFAKLLFPDIKLICIFFEMIKQIVYTNWYFSWKDFRKFLY